MHDHVIWIDKEWWLLAFIIVMMAIYIPAGKGYGPADTLAMGPAVALLTVILFVAVGWLLSLVGIEFGMRG